jgi:membrane-bound metal-dependent hydrolase YbcI (DUF457 family)
MSGFKGENRLFAVGHMAIAYLLGKGSSVALHVKLNIPAVLVLSILPDIDIIYDFLTGSAIHRGPTHSIVVAALVFIPIFIIFGKKAIPYFLALISHSLIGDFWVGARLFWLFQQTVWVPRDWGPFINIFGIANMVIEITLFVVATLVLYKTGDWKVFFSSDKTNLLLIIPVATVLLPSTIGYPFNNSLLLTEPALALAHLFYLVLFSIAIIKALTPIFKKLFHSQKNNGQIS